MEENMRNKKIFAAACAALSAAVIFAGCGKTPADVTPDNPDKPADTEVFREGYYSLREKKVENADVTGDYLFNCLCLSGGEAIWYETDLTGRSEKSGTYTATNEEVTVEIGIRSYRFDYEKGTLTFGGKINRMNVNMSYTYTENYVLPSAKGGAAFTEELFGESKEENFYDYCPTALIEGDTMHVWYCSNEKSGNVTDFIAYRQGKLNAAGKWEFSEKKLVLSPSEKNSGKWDSRHTCDPSVVKGEFSYNGEKYAYLMAYLGCKTSDNTRNEVGLAVAKTPDGEWVKVGDQPIANFYTSADYGENRWGYGQPSLIAENGKGKVILFYSMGAAKTCTIAEEWDFSDLNNPVRLHRAELKERGVVNASGSQDCINNADFAYDPVRGKLYCIKEDGPYPTDGGVNWIAGSNTILALNVGDNFDLLFSGETYQWEKMDTLTKDLTSSPRNHNACIVKSASGYLTNAYRIPVLYTAADLAESYPDWALGGQWPSLHTYRIHGAFFDIR